MRQRTFILLLIVFSSSPLAKADVYVDFGDFTDVFGPVGVAYSSSIPFDPGAIVTPFHEAVVGLEKFDPSLGTLTDVTIFVGPAEPIKYTLGGAMTVFETDPLITTGYGASVDIMGGIELNYAGATPSTILGDMIHLSGTGAGAAGSGSFTTGVGFPGAHPGTLTGSTSVFSSVDLADFIGAGEFVDKLFVDLTVQSTGDFKTTNASAAAALDFDVFAGFSNPPGSPVIGVSYTFTAVPEPSSLALLSLGALSLTFRRRRRRKSNSSDPS